MPEDTRSTIYNIYRLPLNVVVLMPLLMNFSISTTFAVTTSILAVAVAAAFTLKSMVATRGLKPADYLPAEASSLLRRREKA